MVVLLIISVLSMSKNKKDFLMGPSALAHHKGLWVDPADSHLFKVLPGLIDSYCENGRQIKKYEVTFPSQIQPPIAGIPKDIAVRNREMALKKERIRAKNTFSWAYAFPKIVADWTMFIPSKVQERYNINCDGKTCGFKNGQPSPSEAIEDNEMLWRSYFKSFTTVKEYSDNNGLPVFNVSLDLNLFCKYMRPISDLVTH